MLLYEPSWFVPSMRMDFSPVLKHALLWFSDFDQNSEEFKLDLIMRLNFQAYAEDIAEVSNAATMELNIENGLKTIREIWKSTTFELQHHKGDMYKIKTVDDVTQVHIMFLVPKNFFYQTKQTGCFSATFY